MQSVCQYVDASTGKSILHTPDEITLQDHNHWPGLRLEQWEGWARDLDNVVMPHHYVFVNIGEAIEGDVRSSGERRLSGVCRSGTTTIYPAGRSYDICATGYFRGLALAVSPETTRTFACGHAEVELLPQLAVDDPFIAGAARVLADDIRQGYPGGPMYGETIEAALNAHLLRHYAAYVTPSPLAYVLSTRDKELVRHYILDQLHATVRLNDLAQLLQLDLHSFLRRFKRTFGMPPHQFLLRARIQRAKELLRRNEASLVDIALECGFSSHSHFTTAFRRRVGVTPRDYRSCVIR